MSFDNSIPLLDVTGDDYYVDATLRTSLNHDTTIHLNGSDDEFDEHIKKSFGNERDRGLSKVSLDSAGHDKAYTTSSLRSVTINIVNTVVGGGVLALPYSLGLDGSVFGALLIVAVALCSERSAKMLLYVADTTQSKVYSEIGSKIGGYWLSRIVDFTILLQNYGLCISYVVLIGQLLPQILQDWFGLEDTTATRDIILVIVCCCVFFPLCCLKDLNKLRFTSYMALGFVILCVVTVTGLGIRYLTHPDELPESSQTEKATTFRPNLIKFLTSVPILFFSFVAHNNVLLLYSELKRKNAKIDRPSRFSSKRHKHLTAVRIALTLCASLYVLQGVFGYLVFRQQTDQDVLVNFDANKYPFTLHKFFKGYIPLFKLAFVLVLVFSFPVMAYGLRRSIHTFFWGLDTPITTKIRITQAALLVLFSGALGIGYPNVGVVFGLTGSLAASSVMYIYPSSFFAYLRYKGSPRDYKGDYIMASIIFLLGIIVCVGSTIAIIIGIVKPQETKLS